MYKVFMSKKLGYDQQLLVMLKVDLPQPINHPAHPITRIVGVKIYTFLLLSVIC